MKKNPSLNIFLLCMVCSAFIFSCVSAPEKEATLTELIRQGRILEAKERFASRYDINEVDEDGNTALHLAAAMNDSDLTTFLIIKGANPELKNYNSLSPLYLAIEKGSVEAAQTLVTFGANIFSRNQDGVTALDAGFALDDVYYDIFINTKTGEFRDSVTGQGIVHYFVLTKNETAIQTVIRREIPISSEDSEGNTPLNYAFERINEDGMVEIAALLITNGAEAVHTEKYEYFQTALLNRNLNYRFDDGQTPLHLAAIQGHKNIVKYLLDNNAATKVQDSSGSTPLHEAIRYGYTDIASMLIKAGADVNAKDNLGKTPILLVIPETKSSDIYSLLIASEADMKLKDTYGDTVLHMATLTNVSQDILGRLVSAGADVNARNKEGVTPLALSIQNKNIIHTGFYAANGANIHSKDTNGKTPLTMALQSGDQTLETILNKNNINSQDADGNTPLIIAISKDAKLLQIQYILSLNNDVNIRNSVGNTALYIAVLKNRQKVGSLLLEKNADIFSANNKSESPLSLALKAGGSVMDWIITSKTISATDGSRNTALHYAAEWGLSNAISALIEKGANPEAKNANGETPLFSGAKSENPAIAEKLLKTGSKVNARDNLGSTALHTAVRWGNLETCRILINSGANVNAQNISGKSPLAESVLSGKYEIAKMLMNSGARPDISDTSGRTILMDAIAGRNPTVIKLLLSYRANPQIQEINGRNAYHEAALTGDIQIIDLIRNAGGTPLSRDKAGNTPFSLSLKFNDEVVRSVLGSDITVSDSDGNTPIHIIVKNSASLKMLTLLIRGGYPFDTRNSTGYTPLGIAVEENKVDYAKVLLESGANPFIFIDKKGKNAAQIALEKKNKTILSSIVKNAGTLSDVQGNTILHYAARMSDAATITQLVSFGLAKNVKNISGETPYTTAVRWKKTDAAKILRTEDESK